jgi:hypothetical protein
MCRALLAGLLLTSSRTQVTFCGETITLTDYTLMAAFFIPLHVAAIFCGLQFRFKVRARVTTDVNYTVIKISSSLYQPLQLTVEFINTLVNNQQSVCSLL